jgi:3-oxoisoapionate decarboxylase
MLGANEYSYRLACGLGNPLKQHKPLDLFAFMEKCASLGLDGVQVSERQLQTLDQIFLSEIKGKAADLGLHIEVSAASIGDPQIERYLQVASFFGGNVLRSSVGFRLRETILKTRDDWHKFRERMMEDARKVATLAKKYGLKVAIENHFDLTAEELLKVVETDPDSLGVCLDTANSFAVVQEPKETASLLAKYVISSHLKDFLVLETPLGYTLYNVPFGEGHVDLQYVVNAVRQYNPGVMYSIEMVSGRTFPISSLEESFYSGYDERDALDLVKVLRLVRDHPKKPSSFIPLETFTDDNLAYEEANMKSCVKYAREVLKL